MPRKKEKVWIWNGEKVSKTTYFRRKKKANPMAGLKAEVKPQEEVLAQRSAVVGKMKRDRRAPLGLTEVSSPESVPPTSRPERPPEPMLTETEDALVRDAMVVFRANILQVRTDMGIMVTPRTFLAIVKLLDKLGY